MPLLRRLCQPTLALSVELCEGSCHCELPASASDPRTAVQHAIINIVSFVDRIIHIFSFSVLWIGFCLTGLISLCLDSFLYMCVSLYIARMCRIVTWRGGGGGIQAYP